jgi:hypothetical protein
MAVSWAYKIEKEVQIEKNTLGYCNRQPEHDSWVSLLQKEK